MRRLLAIAATAAVLAAAPAIASAEVTKWVAVDSVGASHQTIGFSTFWVLAVSGIREGEDAPSTEVLTTFTGSASSPFSVGEKTHDRCHQMALLALTKPGRFRLDVSYLITSSNLRLDGCTLTRID